MTQLGVTVYFCTTEPEQEFFKILQKIGGTVQFLVLTLTFLVPSGFTSRALDPLGLIYPTKLFLFSLQGILLEIQEAALLNIYPISWTDIAKE